MANLRPPDRTAGNRLLALLFGALLSGISLLDPGGCLAADLNGASARSEGSHADVTLYDSNPGHPWNRLHAALFGTRSNSDLDDPLGGDDPLYERLANDPARQREALEALKVFLDDSAPPISHPLKRALLQHDLWWAFDVSDGEWADESGRSEFRKGLSRAIRKLALNEREIRALPDNLAQAALHDPDFPTSPFGADSPWITLGTGAKQPAARQHDRAVSMRAAFIVLFKHPQGRAAGLAYLTALRRFPNPVIANPNNANSPMLNPLLPQFPAGTKVALVRKAALIDEQGRATVSPLVVSVQTRTFKKIAPEDLDDGDTGVRFLKEQRVFKATLNREELLSGHGGLKRDTPALATCAGCHSNYSLRFLTGIHSVNTYNGPLFQGAADFHGLEPSTPAAQEELARTSGSEDEKWLALERWLQER